MKRILTMILAAAMLVTVTGCGSEPAATTAPADSTPAATQAAAPADMQSIYDSMTAHMPEMIKMDADMMLNFCGIASEDCVQAAAAICSDGLRTDEIWLIEARDEEALARVVALAETRLQMKGEESISYSPEQYAVVEKAQIITDGLYFALIVSPDVDTLAEIFNAAIG